MDTSPRERPPAPTRIPALGAEQLLAHPRAVVIDLRSPGEGADGVCLFHYASENEFRALADATLDTTELWNVLRDEEIPSNCGLVASWRSSNLFGQGPHRASGA